MLNPDFEGQGLGDKFQSDFAETYESFSYLYNINTRDLQKLFLELRKPFEVDEKENIIDYNWHVDGILKNSQSYNKEGSDKKDQ